MSITPSQAAKLLRLQQGETLRRSELSKQLRDGLLSRGAIMMQRSGSGHLLVAHPDRLTAVIANQYGIRDLQLFADLQVKETRTRGKLTQATGDSKSLPHSPMRGIYLRTLGNARIFLRNTTALVPTGSALYVPVEQLEDLTLIPNRLLGIENAEVFLNIERLQISLSDSAIAVLRWHWGLEWREWLGEHAPEFFYAGDYDWAGVAIFEQEVLAFASQARFLVPEDLEQHLQNGNRKLFQRQFEKYKGYEAISVEGRRIYEAVKRNRKAVEQETLLVNL